MNRLWSRVGIRVASVGLLVLGVVGGVYLGKDEVSRPLPASRNVEAQLAFQADASELRLLKERQNEHAAVRAFQREAGSDAAAKAATEAKAAASRARTLEKAAIAKKKKQEKAAAEAAAKKAAESAAASNSGSGSGSEPGSGSGGTYEGPIPSSCGDYSGNKATGCALLLSAGFGISQMPCLDKLWTKESHWRTSASNSSSGAYGIPQALPGSKMSSVGSDWRTNPATQIKWGLGYIEGRYGTPCSAWSHSQNSGWY